MTGHPRSTHSWIDVAIQGGRPRNCLFGGGISPAEIIRSSVRIFTPSMAQRSFFQSRSRGTAELMGALPFDECPFSLLTPERLAA